MSTMKQEASDFKKDVINQLRKKILHLEGFKLPSATAKSFGLGPFEAAFPNSIFPAGAIHEFLNTEPEYAAACGGFIGGLLQSLMKHGGACLWISTSRTLFPPSLKAFGVEPDRIIFVDLYHEKDVLWAMEEALKCEGLAAVIAEVGEIGMTASRRLQLAVEKSRVTGLILRNDAQKLTTTACAARWQIKPAESQPEDGMPGLGFPRWHVELLKVRNGSPGSWKIEWSAGRFNLIDKNHADAVLHKPIQIIKTGS